MCDTESAAFVCVVWAVPTGGSAEVMDMPTVLFFLTDTTITVRRVIQDTKTASNMLRREYISDVDPRFA